MYISIYEDASGARGGGGIREAGTPAETEGRGRTGRDHAESLLRFERGQVSEFGSRKLLAVLAVLGMEITFVKTGMSGSLDELRRERGGA